MTSISKTGAAHAGLIEWLVQRLTAVYMVLFIGFLLLQLDSDITASYQAWSNSFDRSLVRWGWMLFYISALWHSWIGLRSVFLDYIKPFWLRLVLTLGTAVALFVHCMWVIDILYIRGVGSIGGSA